MDSESGILRYTRNVLMCGRYPRLCPEVEYLCPMGLGIHLFSTLISDIGRYMVVQRNRILRWAQY